MHDPTPPKWDVWLWVPPSSEHLPDASPVTMYADDAAETAVRSSDHGYDNADVDCWVRLSGKDDEPMHYSVTISYEPSYYARRASDA